MNRFLVSLAAISLLMFFPWLVSAQTGTFTKVFYDMGGTAQVYTMVATPDHNFLLAGERDYKPLALKISQDGNVFWQRTLGLSSARFNCAATTQDSGYILAGTVPALSPDITDLLCVRLNTGGDTLWSRVISMGQDESLFAVRETSDHGFILAGYSALTWDVASCIVAIRLDSAGNLLWGRSFYSGNSANTAHGVDQTPDGGFILTGSIATATPYKEGLLLMKLNPDGLVSWVKKETFPVTNYSQGYDVKVIPGGVMVLFSASNDGMGLLKTDFSGNMIWARTYFWGSSLYYGSPGPKLGTSLDGGFQFTMFSQFSPGFIGRTDSSGMLLWSSDLVLISVAALETSDNGTLIAGNGPILGVNMSPTDNLQVGIIKTDSSGNSSDCVYSGGSAENSYSVNFETPVLTANSLAVLSPIHPAVNQNFDLSESTGCITVTGGQAEDPDRSDKLIVFPNPTEGTFMVRMEKPGTGKFSSLEIYNAMGSLVYRSSVANILQPTVRMHNPPAGIYLVRAVSGGYPFMQRLVVCR